MASKGQRAGKPAVAAYILLVIASVAAVVVSWIVGDLGFALGFSAIALMAGARISELLVTLGSVEVAYESSPTMAATMPTAPTTTPTTATTCATRTNQTLTPPSLVPLVGLVVVFMLAKVLVRQRCAIIRLAVESRR